MQKLAIVGAGGHGKVAADIAELSGWEQIEFFDDHPNPLYPWSIVGSCNDLLTHDFNKYEGIFIAMGNNTHRKKFFTFLRDQNANLISLIHPNAIISSYTSIENGCLIAANAVINVGSIISTGCIINTGAIIDHDCIIGDFSHIAPRATLAGHVHIGKNSWVGLGSAIIQQIKIADNIYIGAGSLVVNNLELSGLYYGTPAILKKDYKC